MVPDHGICRGTSPSIGAVCGNYTGWNYDLDGSVSSKPQLKGKNQMQSTRGIKDHGENLRHPGKIAQPAAVSRSILRRQPSPPPAKESSTTQKKGARVLHGDPDRRTTTRSRRPTGHSTTDHH